MKLDCGGPETGGTLRLQYKSFGGHSFDCKSETSARALAKAFVAASEEPIARFGWLPGCSDEQIYWEVEELK